MKPYKAILIVLLVLLLDQGLKIWVKTHMIVDGPPVTLSTWLQHHNETSFYNPTPGELIITNWFRIRFVENDGMAFSMHLPGQWGHIMLRMFRLIAVVFGIIYIRQLFTRKAHWGFITAACIILAGAVGNLIDGAFYGLLFSDSYMHKAAFLPAGGGYAGFMQGDVVDMLSFPLFSVDFPHGIPFVGGQHFEFFNAIFNISDAAIFIGVVLIILFQKQFFKKEPVETPAEPEIIAPEQSGENHLPDQQSFPA